MRSNRKRAFRLLLLCGYVFFFAGQFNSRYYFIANNFVYGSGSVTQTGGVARAHLIHARCENTQNPAHLGIDKRFSCPTLIQPDVAHFEPLLPSYIIISRKALPPPAAYIAPDLPTNSFRGPPAA